MTHLLATLAILLYSAAAGLLLGDVWRARGEATRSRFSGILFLCALILHTVTMGLVIQDPKLVLLSNGADYFLWVSWGLAVAFAVLRRKLNYPIIGAFVIPAVVLFMGSSSYLLHKASPSILESSTIPPRQDLFLSMLHAVPALVSVVSLALALVVSVVFLIVERRLKRRKGAALTASGPNLQLLDRLNRRLVQIGFVAISLVVLSGGLWAVSEQKPVFSADTSVISGLAVWLLLAFILHVRTVLRWSPKQVSRLTVVVTASFFVAIFVVLAVAGQLTHAELWS